MGGGETSQCDQKKFLWPCIGSLDHVFLVGNETLPARTLITRTGLSIQYPSALLSSVLFNAKLLLNYIHVRNKENIQK